MTGRYLYCSVRNSFPYLLILIIHSYVSAPTCPFRRLRRHLSQGKASHSLSQRRSAPRKVVRLLPDKRGRLASCILPFVIKQQGRLFYMSHFGVFWLDINIKKYNFFSLLIDNENGGNFIFFILCLFIINKTACYQWIFGRNIFSVNNPVFL